MVGEAAPCAVLLREVHDRVPLLLLSLRPVALLSGKLALRGLRRRVPLLLPLCRPMHANSVLLAWPTLAPCGGWAILPAHRDAEG